MTDFGVRGPKNSALRPKTWGEVNFRRTKKSGPGGQECQFFWFFFKKQLFIPKFSIYISLVIGTFHFWPKNCIWSWTSKFHPFLPMSRLDASWSIFKNPCGVKNEKYIFFPDWDDLISLLQILKTLKNAYFRPYLTHS